MIKTFIFDLDGTLYPRTSPLFAAMSFSIKQWFQDQLKIKNEDMDSWYEQQKLEHPTPLGTIQSFGLSAASFHQEVFEKLNPGLYLEKDIMLEKMLSQLSGNKFVVTLSQYEHAVKVLNALGIQDCFSDILVHDRNWHTNSKLDAYEIIRKANNLIREEVCIIGDNPFIDLQEAHEVEYKCVAVSDSSLAYGKTINTLIELIDAIQDA